MQPRVILTDIEGTTSSISFVKNVLFPYARQALPGFVAEHGQQPEVRRWLDAVATEIGGACQDSLVAETLQGWIDQDRKHTALKALQGLIWDAGYRRGDYTAHFYPEVAPVLKGWHASGLPLYVYSSGSVPAQKLFFGFSDAGDLSPLVSGWFDTEVVASARPTAIDTSCRPSAFPLARSCSCPTWSRNWTPPAKPACRHA